MNCVGQMLVYKDPLSIAVKFLGHSHCHDLPLVPGVVELNNHQSGMNTPRASIGGHGGRCLLCLNLCMFRHHLLSKKCTLSCCVFLKHSVNRLDKNIDSSMHALRVGAVLSQRFEGKLHPCAFFFLAVSPPQIKIMTLGVKNCWP